MKRRRGLAVALALAAGGPWPTTRAAPSTGDGLVRLRPGDALRAAVAAAPDGAEIELEAGVYEGQSAVITQRRLVLRAVDGPVLLQAAGAHAEGKALLVVRGGDVQIDGITFRGARVPDGNGAGIRFERGRLRLRRCAFFDNEMGVLTANQPDAALAVEDCRFGLAPRHAGSLHHLLYVGRIAQLRVSGSQFSGGWRGHLLKSRAARNLIVCNQLDDGLTGEASYQVDLPNAGVTWLLGNVLGQGPSAQNLTLLAYGAEGPMHADSALYVAHNTFINRATSSAPFVRTWPQRLQGGVETVLRNNLLVGDGEIEGGPRRAGDADTYGNVWRPLAALDTTGSVPWRLRADVLPLPAVAPAGTARGVSLAPQHQIALPLGLQPLAPPTHWRPGAFQH